MCTSTRGNSDASNEAADKMVATPQTEDTNHRDWRKDITFVKENEDAYRIERTDVKITKLMEKKNVLEGAIVATDTEILVIHEEQAETEVTRTSENGAFL